MEGGQGHATSSFTPFFVWCQPSTWCSRLTMVGKSRDRRLESSTQATKCTSSERLQSHSILARNTKIAPCIAELGCDEPAYVYISILNL
jgi:hypothetical protein